MLYPGTACTFFHEPSPPCVSAQHNMGTKKQGLNRGAVLLQVDGPAFAQAYPGPWTAKGCYSLLSVSDCGADYRKTARIIVACVPNPARVGITLKMSLSLENAETSVRRLLICPMATSDLYPSGTEIYCQPDSKVTGNSSSHSAIIVGAIIPLNIRRNH